MTTCFEKCGHPHTPENTVTVAGRFEYCRICNRQRANERYRSRHPNAVRKAYLSLDEKLDALIKKTPGHWLWQGQMREGSSAVCYYDHKLIFVARELWERKHGTVPSKHCVYRVCPLSRCVYPQCHVLRFRASHITDEMRGIRGKPAMDFISEGVGRPIYGMSPEAAAIFGLIDDEQYMSRYEAL